MKQSLQFAVICSRKKGNLVQYFQAVVFTHCAFNHKVGQICCFSPKLCTHCLANAAFLLKCSTWCFEQVITNPKNQHFKIRLCFGLDLLGLIIERTLQVCAPCEEGKTCQPFTHKKDICTSQLLRICQIQNSVFVRNTILFSVSEHDAHFTPGYPRVQGSIPLDFSAQSLSAFYYYYCLGLCRSPCIFGQFPFRPF